MTANIDRIYGEMLVKANVVSQTDLETALQRSASERVGLGRILVGMGAATEWEIAAALGKELGIPFITLSHFVIEQDVIDSVPWDIAAKHLLLPVDVTQDTLTILFADIANTMLCDELSLLTHCKVIPVVGFESDVREAIGRYYPEAPWLDRRPPKAARSEPETARPSPEPSCAPVPTESGTEADGIFSAHCRMVRDAVECGRLEEAEGILQVASAGARPDQGAELARLRQDIAGGIPPSEGVGAKGPILTDVGGGRPPQRKILVVCGEPILTIAEILLRSRGFSVALAANILEAQKRIDEERPHLVILDSLLFGGPGGETTSACRLAKAWREAPEHQGMAIAVLTHVAASHPLWDVPESEFKFDVYIPKPFKPEELLREVEAFFEKAGRDADAPHVQ